MVVMKRSGNAAESADAPAALPRGQRALHDRLGARIATSTPPIVHTQVRDLIAKCPPKEVVVYEDEIDIQLNPKLGLDWTTRSSS